MCTPSSTLKPHQKNPSTPTRYSNRKNFFFFYSQTMKLIFLFSLTFPRFRFGFHTPRNSFQLDTENSVENEDGKTNQLLALNPNYRESIASSESKFVSISLSVFVVNKLIGSDSPVSGPPCGFCGPAMSQYFASSIKRQLVRRTKFR